MSVFGVFLARIFPHSDKIFSLNAGKYGPEKLSIWTLFTQCNIIAKTMSIAAAKETFSNTACSKFECGKLILWKFKSSLLLD